MYDEQTFETIMDRMLMRVPSDIDKREGSVIYDALAPAAAELAQMYAELDVNYNLSFADTASEDYLTRRTAEFGVNRKPATYAQRMGLFYTNDDIPYDVPIGSRYAIAGISYIATSRIAAGQFKLDSEVAGIVGNQQFGTLLPINYVDGLARAEITDIIIPGEDEETDSVLRSRYFDVINEPAFGGNESDYRQRIKAINGVGATKVYPAWDGGGTVKVTIIASDWSAPSPTLVSDVQTLADPEVNSGQGLGFAPIGHRVTVAGVSNVIVNAETSLTLGLGISIGEVQADVEDAIAEYLADLCKDWAGVAQIVVRIAQVDARILTVQGVIDVSDTKLNGLTANLTLQSEEIPILGTVTINE